MIKILRGKIIDFLFRVYPREIEELAVISVFFEYHKTDEILQALEYLSGKAYITRAIKPHPYKSQENIRLYKISPSGIDLRDCIISDPAVTIIPESIQNG